jgi:sec-independent protein translocase protein TatA
MGALSPVHWAIIAGVVLLMFGSKRLPDAARAVGQSMRILRAETSQLHTEKVSTEKTATEQAVPRPSEAE